MQLSSRKGYWIDEAMLKKIIFLEYSKLIYEYSVLVTIDSK